MANDGFWQIVDEKEELKALLVFQSLATSYILSTKLDRCNLLVEYFKENFTEDLGFYSRFQSVQKVEPIQGTINYAKLDIVIIPRLDGIRTKSLITRNS